MKTQDPGRNATESLLDLRGTAMLLDHHAEDLLSPWASGAVRPVLGGSGRRISTGSVDDTDVPTFTRLRAELGLPVSDRRWWPAGGRHLAVVAALEVANPTVDLLERTLAGLRAWAPAASDR